jgi:hypothetical protein
VLLRCSALQVYDTCNDGLAPPPSSAKPEILRAPSGSWQRRQQQLGDSVHCLNAVLGQQYFDNAVVRKAWHVDQVQLTHWETCYDIDYSTTIHDERDMYRTLIANMKVTHAAALLPPFPLSSHAHVPVLTIVLLSV